MKISHLACLALAVLCAGCVDVDKEVAASPQEYWQPVERAQPAPLTPLPAAPANLTAAPLTLPALVDIALTNNPLTRVAWYNAKSAADRLGQTNSQYYPQVTLNGTVDRDKVRVVGLNGQNQGVGTTYSTFYGPSIEINYVLWNFGKNYALTESARQALYAADYDYNQQIEDVILDTELAYFNFDAAQGFVAAAQATLDDANTNYKAADQRLTAGLGTRPDERQAFAQVQSAEYQLYLAQAQVETTRAQLAQTLGITVTADLKIQPSEKMADATSLDENIDNLMATAMRERPDLMAAYANYLSAQYSVSAAKDDRWPVISAFADGTYGYEYGGVTTGNPTNNYMVGLQLSWQIFTGFEKTYAILNAEDQAEAARATLHAQQLKVVTDIWNYFYSYKSALQQVGAATAQVDAQQEAYNAISAGYNNGLNTYVDLLTALSNLATARQQKVQADANLGASIANLAHATGRIPITPVAAQTP
jgi:outer membrane protein TolC